MADLVEVIFQFFVALAVSTPRIFTALYFIPLFSQKNLQGILKYATITAISLPVAVSNYFLIGSGNIPNIFFPLYLVKETLIGFILGYFLASPFWVFQAVGAMIDNQRGALSGGYFNPGAGPDSSMLADFLTKSLVVVMIVSGSFSQMFALIIESYVLWPTLTWFPDISPDAHKVLITQFGHIVYSFVLYAGPIILVLLLVEGAFAVLGAYSPQMQVYFMAMPAKSLIALIVLILYLATLWHVGIQDLTAFDRMRQSLIDIFGAG